MGDVKFYLSGGAPSRAVRSVVDELAPLQRTPGFMGLVTDRDSARGGRSGRRTAAHRGDRAETENRFAILPSATNLWVNSSLAQRQRPQQVFEGGPFDGKRPVGTGTTLPIFNHLGSGFGREKRVGGPDGSRTRDLMNAIHARSQLRYWPTAGDVNVDFTRKTSSGNIGR
jgi:hypothetical protein